MAQSTPSQLTLGVSLDDDARFENFLIGEPNRLLVENLRRGDPDARMVFLWGAGGSGLTHLLQAMCHDCSDAGAASIYLPLREREQLAPSILDGTSMMELVCIDDIDAVAGDAGWEAALFSMYNAIRDGQARLVIAARKPPQKLGIALPDLASRLQGTLVFQLNELDDEDKLQALQMRAHRRGIGLSRAVADYIVQRSERSLSALMQVLDRLEDSTLEQRRRLTIPLVKSTMGW